MKLTLARDVRGDSYTYGRLSIPWLDQFLTLETIERPWIPDPAGGPGGHQDTSCIPAGVYTLALHDTPRHPRSFAFVNHDLNVWHEGGPPGSRNACLIHPANWAAELAGCVACGLARSFDNGAPDVLHSQIAFARLQALVPWEEGHTIEVVWRV